MAKLDVGKPFGDNVEKSSIDSNCRAYDGDDNPALGSIIRLSYPVSPVEAAGVPEPRISFSARLSAQLFSRRILHPVCRLSSAPACPAGRAEVVRMSKVYHTDGGEVLLGPC